MEFKAPINLYDQEYKSLDNCALELPERLVFRIEYPLKNAFKATVVKPAWNLHDVLWSFDVLYRAVYQEEAETDARAPVLEWTCLSCSKQLDKYEKTLEFERFDESSCRICMCDRMSTKAVLACGHKFHYKCVRKWFEQSNRCPLCNQTIHACPDCGGRRCFEVLVDFNAARRAQGLDRAPTQGKYEIGAAFYEDLMFSGYTFDQSEGSIALISLSLT